MNNIRLIVIAVVAVLTTACGSSTEPAPPLPNSERVLVASKVAIAAIAVAVGDQGRSFFDNFLSCPRRGVIDYRNASGGRRATFTGCDLGDGVVLDGSAQIDWTRATADNPATTTALSIDGDLRVRVNGSESFAVGRVDARNITFSLTPTSPTEGIPLVDLLSAVRVESGNDAGFPLDSRANPRNVFHPPVTANAIPNAANSLDALEDRDVKRASYHHMLAIASILFNETLEIQRGTHTHATVCGTVAVTPIVGRNLPRLNFDWTDCDAGLGSFVGGRFTAEWSEFDASTGRLHMVLDGNITLGGGVPRTTFSHLDWSVGGINSLPTTARISGTMTVANRDRPFEFLVEVDD